MVSYTTSQTQPEIDLNEQLAAWLAWTRVSWYGVPSMRSVTRNRASTHVLPEDLAGCPCSATADGTLIMRCRSCSPAHDIAVGELPQTEPVPIAVDSR